MLRPPSAHLILGRAWLEQQTLPVDERRTVAALLRQIAFYGAEIAKAERRPAAETSDHPVRGA